MTKATVTHNIDQMYSTLRKRILFGEYKSGEKLSETQLSKEFYCSRTPIREVLKRLEQDLLVAILPKSGSYIRKRSSKENREALEVRAYIEGLSVRLIIELQQDFSPLSNILDRMDDILEDIPLDIVSFGDLHYEFHHTLVMLSENSFCISLFEKLNLRSSMQFFETVNKNLAKRTQEEHRKLVYYMDQHDKKRGERLAIDHLWNKRDRIKD